MRPSLDPASNPNKDVRAALRDIMSWRNGDQFRLRPGGHWGTLVCTAGCCLIPVPGTPKNGGNAARQLLREARKCPRPPHTPHSSHHGPNARPAGAERTAETTEQQTPAAVAFPAIMGVLNRTLGPGLVAVIADVPSEMASSWTAGSTPSPDPAVEGRVRAAHDVFQQLWKVEDVPTIRAWFMGSNPELGELSPAESIADGDVERVRAIARAFIAGG